MVNLEGRHFRIAANEVPPWLYLNTTLGYGVENMLLDTLSKYLNFTYNLFDCGIGGTGNFGKVLPNGSWDGLMGKEADFGISHLYMTAQRAEAITFTYPPHLIDFATFTSPLPQVRENIVSFLEPFDTMIWIFLILYLMSNYFLGSTLFNQEYRIFLISLSILMRQPQPVPNETTVRLLLYAWFLSVIGLTAFYSGSVFSHMTKPFEMGRIDTISELADAQRSGRIQVIGLDNGFYYNMIKKSDSGPCAKIGTSISSVDTHNTAIDLLKDSVKNYAYVQLREKLCHGLRESNNDKYYVPAVTTFSESIFATNQIAMVLSKNFAFVKEFNQV